MDRYMIDSKDVKILERKISKSKELELNHIYDMGDNWLISVRTDKDVDLMDPYYIADKKSLKIYTFKLLDHLSEFNKALKNKVY